MDPVLLLRRPVTPFGVGTILDGSGIGGGLEIVESGCWDILWEVAGDGGERRRETDRVPSVESRGARI